MPAWRLAHQPDYRRLELRAHDLLAEVPLHDVWQLDLPGGGFDRTIADVRSLMTPEHRRSVGPVVRLLFALRAFLGKIFRWDEPNSGSDSCSFLDRLDDEDRTQSLVEPGSQDGPFTVLYVHPSEAVSEVRNATVHAFLVFALVSTSSGYRLFWAIYVLPVGRITALYMALIDPFRRWLVYPAILRQVHRSWSERYGS